MMMYGCVVTHREPGAKVTAANAKKGVRVVRNMPDWKGGDQVRAEGCEG